MRLKDALKNWGTAPFYSWLEAFLNDSQMIVRSELGLRRLKVVVRAYESSCCTNGLTIFMGGQFSPMIDETLSKEERLEIFEGGEWHEDGHVFFTPFSAFEIAQKAVEGGTLWPKEPENMTEKLREYLRMGDAQRKRLLAVYMEFANCLEDGRVENLLLEHMWHFRGFSRALLAMREYFRGRGLTGLHIAQRLRAFREDPESPVAKEELYQAAAAAVLMLSKYGDIPQIERIREDARFAEKIRKAAPHIAAAVESAGDAPEFFSELNYVFCELSEYVFPYLESLSEDAGSEDAGCAKEILESMGLGPLPKDRKGEIKAASEKIRAELRKKSSRAKPRGKESEKEKPSEELSEVSSCSPWKEHPSKKRFAKEKKAARGLDPEMIVAEKVAEGGPPGAPEEGVFCAEGERIGWKIRRAQAPVSAEAEYRTYGPYIEIGKTAAKKIRPYFDPVRRSAYEKNRYCGTRLMTARLSSPSLRYFERKAALPKSPSLSVAVLVDESGSMYGKNIEAAKAAAISLFEMCKALDIPYGVFGHTCHDQTVEMTGYCMFGQEDASDQYRLLDIRAREDNRDGAALRYTAELLSVQQTDRRLLIVISDGQPAAPGYYGDFAKRDIREVISRYERKGVRFLAAAIDKDKDAIQRIYGPERFLDITDLSLLPKKLLDAVRRQTL